MDGDSFRFERAATCIVSADANNATLVEKHTSRRVGRVNDPIIGLVFRFRWGCGHHRLNLLVGLFARPIPHFPEARLLWRC